MQGEGAWKSFCRESIAKTEYKKERATPSLFYIAIPLPGSAAIPK